MPPQWDIVLGVVLLCAILGGLFVRRRLQACVAFTFYLLVSLIGSGVRLAGILDWRLWALFGAMQAAASVAVVLEVGARTYHRRISGGRPALARRLLLGLSLGLAAVIAWGIQPVPVTSGEAYDSFYELDRRLNALAGWLCALVLAFSAHNWTLDAWHRDMLAGLLVYRLGFSVLSTLALSPTWPTWLYAVTLLWWLRGAWRHDDSLADWPPWLVALVFPWRARL